MKKDSIFENRNGVYESIEDVIDLFENGKERFQNDALFCNIVHSIYLGYDPIKLLDQTVKVIEDQRKVLNDAFQKGIKLYSFDK